MDENYIDISLEELESYTPNELIHLLIDTGLWRGGKVEPANLILSRFTARIYRTEDLE